MSAARGAAIGIIATVIGIVTSGPLAWVLLIVGSITAGICLEEIWHRRHR